MKNNNFIERSLLGALNFFKESIFSEEFALRQGFLQSIDPRIKTLTILLFLVAVLFIKNIQLLIYLYLFCLLLVLLSKIKLGFFLKRTWIFIPLFSLFIAIPALFSIFSPGEPLLSFRIFGAKLMITRQGLAAAALFVMRVLTSVSFVILLGLTTRHFELLRVLRIFRIPQVFVMTLGMCYRYIYLFVETVENTYLAIKSRVGTNLHYKHGQKIVGWRIASLWQRSVQLNNEVYNAMLSRGYTGEPRILEEFRVNAKDWAWAICAVIICSLIVYLNGKYNL